MRDYARIAPTFWLKGSGRRLRGDPRAQIVALYLVTCPTASMVGIFYLSIPTIVHETGLAEGDVRHGLARCAEAEFAFYDDEAELVWVPHMARYQIGDSLLASDRNRRKGILSALAPYQSTKFYADFVSMYDAPFRLGLLGASSESASRLSGAESEASCPDLPGAGSEEGNPFEGVSKGYRRGIEGVSKPLRRGAESLLNPFEGGSRARVDPDPAPVPVLDPDPALGGPGGRYPLRADFALTAERRAFAEMVPLRDVPEVFAKFQCIAVEQQWCFDAAGWEARWKRFANDERRYQERERGRDRGAPVPPNARPDLRPVPPLPGQVRRPGPKMARAEPTRPDGAPSGPPGHDATPSEAKAR